MSVEKTARAISMKKYVHESDRCKTCGHARQVHFLYSMTEDVCEGGRQAWRRSDGGTCKHGCRRYVEVKKHSIRVNS